MLRKLGKITVLSSLGALLNFVTTFIIVHKLGLGILGVFTVINSITALCSVVYTILPSNYSIFKYQDDVGYKYILTSFYFSATILFILVLFILFKFHSFSNLSFGLVVYNGLTTIAFYYFDIIYQATNRLYRYFGQLLLQAALKIILIYVFVYYHLLTDVRALIFVVSTAQLICLFPYLKDLTDNIQISKTFFVQPVIFIRSSINDLKAYYLNSIIKRIRDNIIIVLFSTILPSELLGLYTLFIKLTSFILSLGRSFEAFFTNRENMEKYHKTFNAHILLLGGILQVAFLSIGIVYMKIYTHNFYAVEIIILSFLVYPYSRFIVERIKFLGNYNNKELNMSMLLYIIFVLATFLICKLFTIISLYAILLVYFTSELINYFYLIYQSIKVNHNKKFVKL
ncbi:MAG TPA: hypothetical protein VIM16_17645 [Mucilaginibacter sp.]|jgi:O-antigen/teichoic acid export membrane protein